MDSIPIRRFVSSSEVGLQYPSKPMKAYATIWDGSTWATHGGQNPVDYSKGPFDASFTNLKLDGCVWDPMEQSTPPDCAMPNNGDWLTDSVMQEMSSDQIVALNWARTNYMWYSYCDDLLRYPTQPPPECPTRGRRLNCVLVACGKRRWDIFIENNSSQCLLAILSWVFLRLFLVGVRTYIPVF